MKQREGGRGVGVGVVWSGEERQRICKKSQTPLPVSAVTVI